MKNQLKDVQFESTMMRNLLLTLAALALTTGCGKPAAYEAVPFTPPIEFKDGRRLWELSDEEPSAADNQKIGAFFRQRPELVGSPEWTGQPEKYRNNSLKLTRFYWYSGNKENPSWNALEMNGPRVRELSGTGSPGDEEEN